MEYDYRLNLDYILRVIKRILIIILGVVCYRIVEVLELGFFTDATLKLIIISIILQNFLRIISRTFVYIYLRSKGLSYDLEDLFVVGMKHIFNGVKVVIIFLLALYLYGVDIPVFFTSLTLVGVAMAILFKEFISNMLNGMYLFFSDKFNLKQYVEINGVRGVITDISFQAIEMKNDSNDYVYIPNSTIQSKEIINYSKESLKEIRIEIALLRDEMPLIKRIEKEVKSQLSKKYGEILSKKTDEPVTLEYEEILSKKVSFRFIIKTSKYSFKIEREIKQFTLHVIGELLIKYHKSEKSKQIEMES